VGACLSVSTRSQSSVAGAAIAGGLTSRAKCSDNAPGAASLFPVIIVVIFVVVIIINFFRRLIEQRQQY
jgi:hypothetical protein